MPMPNDSKHKFENFAFFDSLADKFNENQFPEITLQKDVETCSTKNESVSSEEDKPLGRQLYKPK